jgi:anionic cell wall polymer biosynthesis LytR-Cps2A-Psr (LCP) family protein
VRGLRPSLRALVATGLVIWVVVGGVVVWVEYHLWAQTGVVRGAFDGLGDRPSTATSGARNYVVMLSAPYERPCTSPACWAGTGGTPLVVHFDPSFTSADVIAWPDLSVDATVSPAAVVDTIESTTGVRMEHMVVVRWDGLARLIDRVGGVQVELSAPSTDPDTGTTWVGDFIDGAQALAFISQRRGLSPTQPHSPVVRQLAVLRETMDVALAQEMRTEPWLLYGFAHELARSVSLDEEWSVAQLRNLAWSLRSLRSQGISYAMVPGQTDQADALWEAVRNDTVGTWLDEHPEVTVPPVIE